MTVELSDQEMMRYNRQIVLRGFDFEGQEALKAASVLVVGLGGLGCAAAQPKPPNPTTSTRAALSAS